MATETLRPNSDGSIELTRSTGSSSYALVDDTGAGDGDSTYVYRSTEDGYARDLYGIPSLSGSVDSINSITVYARTRSTITGGLSKRVIKTHGVEYDGGLRSDNPSYVLGGRQWATNPNTGSAWTTQEITDLQIGVALKLPTGTGGDVRCTQVYVVVDYEPGITNYERSLSTAIGLSATLERSKSTVRSLSTAIGLSATLGRSGGTFTRSLTAPVGLITSIELARNLAPWLCVASRDSGSVKTRDGTNWTTCAKDDSGVAIQSAWFAQFDNRLCVLEYENSGFGYSNVNDIFANWATPKPNFPNLPQKFTDMFVGRNASDTPTLYFLTPKGMFYLDVFTNFVFNPTEVAWEEDDKSGKKGLYWKGDHYIAVNKGIYKISGGVVTLVGPDMDDGLPEDLQGTITDMIGVGFWLVIALDGGASKKSCILKRYITGNHWHPVYVGSLNTPIRALCWDSGTLYFGEGSNVKNLLFPSITDNVKQISDHTYYDGGELIYPYFHSEFEAMPKVAHRVWATTQDCTSSVNILIAYRKDEETAWTELGMFESSPRPTALPFPASGDSIGIQFERIQFKSVYARGDTTTDSPKLESLILEYRVIPPVLWGWDTRVVARTQGDQRGEDIIDALKTDIETGTLLSFYPSGDKSKTEYFVEVKGMPGNEAGTEFGQEGIYLLSLQEAID